MSIDFEQQAGLILAAEDCDTDEFPRLHRFGGYDERLIAKLICTARCCCVVAEGAERAR